MISLRPIKFSPLQIATLITLILFSIIMVWLSPRAIARAGQDSHTYSNDFTVFYAAAESLVKDRDPYHHPIAEKTPYLYPPLFSFLMAPLTFLSLPQAATIWYWLNVVALIILISLLTIITTSQDRERLLLFNLLILMTMRIGIDNLLWGQVNILVSLLLALWLYLSLQKRDVLATVALSLAISIKITPAIFLIYLLIKERRQLYYTLTFLTAFNGLSTILLGDRWPVLIGGWYTRTILNGQGFNWAYAGNQSLRGAITRLFSSGATEARYFPTINLIDVGSDLIALLFVISAILLILLVLYRLINNKLEKGISLAGTALFSSLALLLSNLSWKAHFIMLIFAWSMLIKFAFNSKQAYVWIAINFLLCNIFSQGVVGERATEFAEVYSFYTIAGLICYSLIIWHEFGHNLPNRQNR